MTFIRQRTAVEQTDTLAGYLPNDDLHALKNKDGSNIRKILVGLSTQWNRFRTDINNVYDEYDPNDTVDLITEWETMVGIPDECISNTGTLEERRTNILLKLAGINVTTAKQFENIASILGYDVVVENGVDTSVFPLTLPFILLSEATAPFVIVVTLDASLETEGFPLTFPFTLSSGVPDILLCLFNKLKPANTNVIFRYS
jgi:uncharacterized protein YmfQ (DUF2313 family)